MTENGSSPRPLKAHAKDGQDRVSLTIIVPAYNEEEMISHTVAHLLSTGEQWVDDLEIIIVNDGSTDNTPELVDQLAAQHENVHAYHQNPNQGFGATVRIGYTNASKTYVMVCPVDYLFTLEDFDIYLALIKYSDIVIGYRRHRRLDLPWKNRLISSVYHILVNFLFRLNFFDVNWIHMYRRDQLPLFVGRSDGVFLLAENIINAKSRSLKIVGVDVGFVDRATGVGTGAKLTTILISLRELIVFFFKRGRS